MTKDLFVRFDEVAGSARALATLAGTTNTTFAGLLTAFEGFDAPWGGDQPGQAFFGVYQNAARDALTNAAQVPNQITALATNLQTTVDAYQSTEITNAGEASRIDPNQAAPANPQPARPQPSVIPPAQTNPRAVGGDGGTMWV